MKMMKKIPKPNHLPHYLNLLQKTFHLLPLPLDPHPNLLKNHKKHLWVKNPKKVNNLKEVKSVKKAKSAKIVKSVKIVKIVSKAKI